MMSTAGRWYFPLLVIIIICGSFRTASAQQSDDLYTQGSYEILEGEPISIIFTTVNDTGTEVFDVRLSVDGVFFNANISQPSFLNGTGWVIVCSVTLTFEGSGKKEAIVEQLLSSGWVDKGTLTIDVKEKDDEENTIFGLPRWYCSVSIIVLTIMIIFFTWSYFKGRKMKREMGSDPGTLSIQCSECGKPVGTEERFCPWCGASLDEEEFICGKCRKPVSKDDKKCPHCDAGLLPDRKDEKEISGSNKDTAEKKKKVDMTKKRTCKHCGTVLMKDEKVCPVCKK